MIKSVLSLFLILIAFSVLGQNDLSSFRIPISLKVSGEYLKADQTKLELAYVSNNQMLNGKIQINDTVESQFIVNEQSSSLEVHLFLVPQSLAYEVTTMKLDSLLKAEKIEIEINKILFNKSLAMGLVWERLHYFIEIRLHFNNAETRSIFYSLGLKGWNKKIRKLLKKQKTLKGELVVNPHNGKWNLITK